MRQHDLSHNLEASNRTLARLVAIRDEGSGEMEAMMAILRTLCSHLSDIGHDEVAFTADSAWRECYRNAPLPTPEPRP